MIKFLCWNPYSIVRYRYFIPSRNTDVVYE